MKYAFFLLLITMTIQVLCQIDPDQFSQQFEDYHGSFFLEKIYLQTDKESYSLGDTLWFSAYQVDGRTHVPTRHSLLLYVELISPVNEVIKRLSIAFDQDGRGAGNFSLSDSLDAGNYRLRGYTNYQRNFDEDFFFSKSINVVPRLATQQLVGTKKTIRPLQRKISLDIYPEGGDFVAGLTNYFALEVKDEEGNPLNLSGKIITDTQEAIGEFSTFYEGLGKAQVVIEEGARYACEFEYKGMTFSFPFPPIMDSGYLINIRATDDKVFLVVQGNDKSGPNPYLLVQSRGQILQILRAKQGQRSIYAAFRRDKLPSGLITVTVFSAAGKPMSERIFYNENTKGIRSIQVSPSTLNVGVREQLKLKFELKNAGAEEQVIHLATSVIPASLYTPARTSMQSQLWFLSDLVGLSEVPQIFFAKDDPRRFEFLDLYCLTHGWRRFDWEDVRKSRTPTLSYIPEQGFSLTGRVTSYTNRSKGVASNLYLSFLEDPTLQLPARSDAEGYFRIDGLDVQDSVSAFIKTVSGKKRNQDKDKIDFNTYVTLVETTYPAVSSVSFNKEQLSQADSVVIQRGQKLFDISSAFDTDAIMLDAIAIEEEVDPFVDPFKREFALYRRPDNRVVLDSLVGYNQYVSVFEAIRGRVPGLQVSGSPPNQSALIRGINSLNGNVTPLYLFDGFIVDEAFINTISPQDILYVDVIRNAGLSAMYGSRAAAGVIAVYSRKGDDQRPASDQPAGLLMFDMPGYDVSREFYVPDYARMSSNQRSRPDFRSTVYWNPKITMKGGQAEVSYYTSDEKGLFYIITEGVTEEGQLIQDISSYQVE
jgi:hypothetical protein